MLYLVLDYCLLNQAFKMQDTISFHTYLDIYQVPARYFYFQEHIEMLRIIAKYFNKYCFTQCSVFMKIRVAIPYKQFV